MERIRVATLVRMRLLRALSERGSQIFGRHLLSGISPDAEYLERVVGVWTHRPRTRSEGFSGHRRICLRPDVEARSSSVRRQLPRGIVVWRERPDPSSEKRSPRAIAGFAISGSKQNRPC
jgi:hypothetical protein